MEPNSSEFRAAAYARFSSDLQNPRSADDQLQDCRAFAEEKGWRLVAEYKDEGITGAKLLGRPGFLQMLADARQRKFDVIIAEALDRLTRDQADIAQFYKQMVFYDVTICTKNEGLIDPLKIAFKGTMNSIFRQDLKFKTSRGLRKVVEDKRWPGSIAFGYRTVTLISPDGGLKRGCLVVDKEQAEHVRGIFRDYSDGLSPLQIARKLNTAGVKTVRGGEWTPSTIYGNRPRGTGILNNLMYVGILEYGRTEERINPEDETASIQNPSSQQAHCRAG